MNTERWMFGLWVSLAVACASHEREASSSDRPVPPAELSTPEPTSEPVGEVHPRQPVPVLEGEVASEVVDFDGHSTPDTSHERHTETADGLGPISERMSGELIEVGTMREFVTALGSDRTIVMKAGTYVWRDGDVLDSSDGVSSYDELSEHLRKGTIHDVENLTIVGLGAGPRILQPDGYDHVLAFQDVQGLTLYNLVLGHHVARGGCAGGVLRIVGGRDVLVDGLEMFGSGTEGLTFSHVEDVEVADSVVWGCSEQLSTIFDAKEVVIRDTLFRDNGPGLMRGFQLGNADVVMRRVTIEGNESGSDLRRYGALFSESSRYRKLPGIKHGRAKLRVKVPRGARVKFEDGVIEGNRFFEMKDASCGVDIQRSRVDPAQWK